MQPSSNHSAGVPTALTQPLLLLYVVATYSPAKEQHSMDYKSEHWAVTSYLAASISEKKLHFSCEVKIGIEPIPQ